MRIIQLVNINTLLVSSDLSEAYLPTINVRDSIKITFPTYPNLIINSTVSQKGNVVNPNNRTFVIKTRFQNVDNKIKPNLLAVLKFKDFETPQALLVPTVVINEDIKGTFLFVAKQDGNKTIASKIYIKIGKADNINTIVLEGLKEGDIVITDGYNLIREGNEIVY